MQSDLIQIVYRMIEKESDRMNKHRFIRPSQKRLDRDHKNRVRDLEKLIAAIRSRPDIKFTVRVDDQITPILKQVMEKMNATDEMQRGFKEAARRCAGDRPPMRCG